MRELDQLVAYPEVEKRRKLLGRIQAFLEEGGPAYEQRLFIELTRVRLQELGTELGFDPAETLRRFTGLVEAGYIRIRPFTIGPYAGTDHDQFRKVRIQSLTDRGLREINILPPTESIEGILESLIHLRTTIERDSSLSDTDRERKSRSVQATYDALKMTAGEVGQRVLTDLLARSIGLG